MNEQEKFDDLLRSKLTERDFPFDETNWDKVEELIDRSEKKRRFGIIAFIFLAGLGVGIAIMLPFINNYKTPNSTNTISFEQNTATAEQNKKPLQASNSDINSGGAPGQPITDNNQENGKVSSHTTTSTNNSSARTVKKIRHAKSSISDTGIHYSYVRPSVQKKNHRRVNAIYNTNSNKWVQNKAYTGSLDVSDSNQQFNEAKPNGSFIAIHENKLTNKNTTEIRLSTTPENNSVITGSSVQKSDTLANNHKTLPTNDSITQKRDTSTTTTPLLNPPPIAQQHGYSHTLLSIDAGGGYAFGWKKEGTTQGNGLNPLIGVSVTQYFSHRISACMGVQFNTLTNLNTLYSNNSIQYSFGVNTTTNSVTLKTLYYIALPLKFQYSITDKDIISGGVSFLYLLNTTSSVVSYNQDYFGVSGYTSTTKIGYMDGVNNIDAQLILAYRRKINRFTISIEGYYGLLDIESNTYFENTVFERNGGIRGIVSFDIIK